MQRGNLTQIRPGIWRYRQPAYKRPNGKWAYHSKTFPASGERAAARTATALAKQWDDQTATAAAKRLTVAGLVDDWAAFQAERGQAVTTEYRNRSILAAIRADLGAIPLDQLTAKHLDRWYVSLIGRTGTGKGARPITANTVLHYQRVLKAILAQGYKWEMVAANVADRTTPPKHVVADMAPRMPTPEALAVIMGKASRSARIAILLTAATGARRGEIVGLRWCDLQQTTVRAGGQERPVWVVHIATSIAKVPKASAVRKAPKGRRGRRVPVPDAVVALLHEHRAERRAWAAGLGVAMVDDGPILANLRADLTGATAYTPGWLTREWDRACSAAGVTGLTLHGIRHMHVSGLDDERVPMTVLQARAGHAQMSTTAGYMHVLGSADFDALAAVERLIEPLTANVPSGAGVPQRQQEGAHNASGVGSSPTPGTIDSEGVGR